VLTVEEISDKLPSITKRRKWKNIESFGPPTYSLRQHTVATEGKYVKLNSSPF